jgi:hypothetical protein
VCGDVSSWSDQQWTRQGVACYIARHTDGRARVLYHDGAVRPVGAYREVLSPKELRKRKREAGCGPRWGYADPNHGEEPLAAAKREADAWAKQMRSWAPNDATPEFEFKTTRATSKQSGFGGDAYVLQMADGEELVLRGPWHGGAPTGYVEVSTCDWNTYSNDAISAGTSPYAWLRRDTFAKPWHQRGSHAGLYITEDLFIRLIAHFAPQVTLLRVEHSYGKRLEAADPRWGGVPKAAVYDVEHRKAMAHEPAGEFWRMYWDSRGSYCGRLRTPSYGFEPGVSQHVPEPWYA